MSSTKEYTPRRDLVVLDVPSQLSYLKLIRQSVEDLCGQLGISESDTAQLQMAVDEACANIMEHSYRIYTLHPPAHENARVKLNIFQQKGAIVVELYDHGRGFDFYRHPITPPQDLVEAGAKRGFGMYIIRKFVDEISYERQTDRGNCLRLKKYVSREKTP